MQRQALISLPSRQLWGLLISLAAVFAMGGSSRSDVQSLALLNPLMIACCGAALITLTREHLRSNQWFLAGVVLAILLVAAYLLPVSGKFVNLAVSPGDVATVRVAADMSGAPQNMATAPYAASQSLFFIFAPLAVLLFALQLNRNDLYLSVAFLVAGGAISGMTGVLQLVGNASGPLYFYQITTNGSAVGFFANRNHAAVFLACLFPMLAFSTAKSQATHHGGKNASQLVKIAIAIILVPLILVTGSRSGILSATVGIIGAGVLFFSYNSSYRRSTAAKSAAPIWAAAILVCLIAITIYFSRAESIERIFIEKGSARDRADFWTSSLQLFWHYFPIGFGPGGFVPAFQNTEPLGLLDGVYLNRLHNDWLETALTFGVPGIFLMSAATIYYLHRSFVLWVRMDGQRSAVALGRMASLVIAILAVASLSDYPLRTPAIAGYAALVLVWFAHARHDPNRR